MAKRITGKLIKAPKSLVLFLCSGNTCRSPMAEMIFRDRLKQFGLKGIKALSFGIQTFRGEPMDEMALTALDDMGIKHDKSHKAKQLTLSWVDKADIMFCMTKSQKSLMWGFDNLRYIGDFLGGRDVPDPCGESQSDYDNTAGELVAAIDRIIEKIAANLKAKLAPWFGF